MEAQTRTIALLIKNRSRESCDRLTFDELEELKAAKAQMSQVEWKLLRNEAKKGKREMPAPPSVVVSSSTPVASHRRMSLPTDEQIQVISTATTQIAAVRTETAGHIATLSHRAMLASGSDGSESDDSDLEGPSSVPALLKLLHLATTAMPATRSDAPSQEAHNLEQAAVSQVHAAITNLAPSKQFHLCLNSLEIAILGLQHAWMAVQTERDDLLKQSMCNQVLVVDSAERRTLVELLSRHRSEISATIDKINDH